ncbi:E3 SUMO-protein ligase PIAS2-like isoform X2 [Mytilus edulis]
MADAGELKQMVMSFRVSELQVLLGYAGRNKTGRKTELMQRALQLVQKGASVPIQIKIRELYNQIFSSNRRKPPGKSDEGPMFSSMKLETGHHYRGGLDYSSGASLVSPAQSSMFPVHPDVRLKHLPFYDVVAELMKPTSLAPRGTSKFQETHFNFHLTPQQAQDIAMSRDFRPGARCEYMTQIQLRFCLLETSCEQDDNFPPSICVRVNGKLAPLPNPIPTTKPGVEPKRPGRPVDITSFCRLSPTMPNQIDVSWATDFGRGYCVAIYLVKKLSSDILMMRLKQFGNRHPDHTRALIKEKLQSDPDSEIDTTSLRVSLMCPLGKSRMSIPIRASSCTHLQCCDAMLYLMMNEKKPTWMCPVCDRPAPFHKLVIDGLFVEILKQAPDVDEIQFNQDGNWCRLNQKKETHVISSPVIKNTRPAASEPSGASPEKKPKMDVIDLTCSSDEEDEEEPRTPQPAPSNTSSSSPRVISLDSPTPVHSMISSDSPMLSSPGSNIGSPSSASSSGLGSPMSNKGLSPAKSPYRPSSVAHSLSPVSSDGTIPNPPSPSIPIVPPPPLTSQRPLSFPTDFPSQTNAPLQSPLGSRISPITPPTFPVPMYPPYSLPAPMPHQPPPYNHSSSMNNYAPELDREIEDFIRGIVWDNSSYR